MVTSEFPRPMLMVDCVVFGFEPSTGLQVLLLQRDAEPLKGVWALPGGVVHEQERTMETARRVLSDKVGSVPDFLEQLVTVDTPNRDPRGWVVSVAHYALVRSRDVQLHPKRGVAQWCPLSDVPPLAFDHADILTQAVARLRGKAVYQPIGFNLLERTFTLGELQQLYETILGRPVDTRNFRKKMLAFGMLEEVGSSQSDRQTQATRSGRPATLYRFNIGSYEALVQRGIVFEI